MGSVDMHYVDIMMLELSGTDGVMSLSLWIQQLPCRLLVYDATKFSFTHWHCFCKPYVPMDHSFCFVPIFGQTLSMFHVLYVSQIIIDLHGNKVWHINIVYRSTANFAHCSACPKMETKTIVHRVSGNTNSFFIFLPCTYNNWHFVRNLISINTKINNG
jgi:hypothetical protein